MRFKIRIFLRYDEKRDVPAECHTSDINEELGLVTHLFTDKTGNKLSSKVYFLFQIV